MYEEFLNLMTHMNTKQDAVDELKAQKDYVETTNYQRSGGPSARPPGIGPAEVRQGCSRPPPSSEGGGLPRTPETSVRVIVLAHAVRQALSGAGPSLIKHFRPP